MGFEVAAIGRGDDKTGLAKKLGAHHYIDSLTADVAKELQALGGAALVLATASGGSTLAQTVKGLRPRGHLITLGVTSEPLGVSPTDLIFSSRSVDGALTGDPKTGERALKFSSLNGVAALIETMPLARAPEAYARMMSGQAHFRMVLTMND